MSKQNFNLEQPLTWKGKNYPAGVGELPDDAAAYAKRRGFGTATDEAVSAGQEENTVSNAIGDDGYPDDFPGRKALVKLGKTYEEVKGMSRDDLIKLNGIAEKTADEILAYGKD